MSKRTSAQRKEKRSTPKLDTAIIVALIALAGTIVTAVFGSPVLIELIKSTPVPTIENIGTPSVSLNQSQVVSSSTLSETPLSTSLSYSDPTTAVTAASPSSAVTPVPNSFLITLPAGEKVVLTTITIGSYLQGRYGPVLNGSAAVPLENGSEISFDFIDHVEFGDKTISPRPVIIRLIDNTELKGNLATTAVTVMGETELGPFERSMSDIEAVTIQRTSTSSFVPSSLPSGTVATLYDIKGNQTKVSNPGFIFYQSPVTYGFGTPECNVWGYGYLPTQEGLKIKFSALQEIEFIHDDGLNPILVKIINQDGQAANYHMAATFANGDLALPCKQMSGWWLHGKIALGNFVARISSVSKIVFDSN